MEKTTLHITFTLAGLVLVLGGCLGPAQPPLTVDEKPMEAGIGAFLGEPRMEIAKVSEGPGWPSLEVAVDGTVLVFRAVNALPDVFRSEDGGANWSGAIRIGDTPEHAGRGLGAAVVDETTGDVIIFLDGSGPNREWLHGHSWRSRDHGKTWAYNGATPDIIKPNTSIEIDGVPTVPGPSMTHGSERGITLRHGPRKGRLLVPSRNWSRPGHPVPSERRYSCAIYSDDGGRTWQTSAPFPAYGTGEGSLAELSDGRIFYDSRRHWAPEGVNARKRWFAWSYDGGETWRDLGVSRVLPDGDQNRDYGLKGGLARLPVRGRDILVFSNIESPEGRKGGTVWVSFDGGQTWPVKRLVEPGSFGYSSLAAGRPGTPSEGMIYLHYSSGGSKVARFNLAWVLADGELTGDGQVPGY